MDRDNKEESKASKDEISISPSDSLLQSLLRFHQKARLAVWSEATIPVSSIGCLKVLRTAQGSGLAFKNKIAHNLAEIVPISSRNSPDKPISDAVKKPRGD